MSLMGGPGQRRMLILQYGSFHRLFIHKIRDHRLRYNGLVLAERGWVQPPLDDGSSEADLRGVEVVLSYEPATRFTGGVSRFVEWLWRTEG